jgi:hypothetical protein
MTEIKTVQESLKIRLGSDLKFPIEGSFDTVNGLELLLQDIQQLLLTIPGERVFRPDFGCNLRNQIWENMAAGQINGAASIRQALETFEPRITIINVTSESNENTGLITFNIQFLVSNTDTSINLVFPFRTGTQLSFA